MFFVLVFNVLNALFSFAEGAGIFHPLANLGIKHRLSFFADDVVLLIRPYIREVRATVELLQAFGDASGLQCNLAKSSVTPIRCSEADIQPLLNVLGCPVINFPIQYLGLPLSVYRLSKAQLQPLVDKVAKNVPSWSASLMKKSGRLIYLNSKLAATPIYHMLSLDLPPWFFGTINKLLRGFFWSATTEARKGHCVVAWNAVCAPKDLGGLGIKNLNLLNHALRMRWRWMEMSGEDKPWVGLNFKINNEAEEMLQACVKCEVGNGQRFRFWTDRWLGGRNIQQMAPNLMQFVRHGALTMTVAEALSDDKWIVQIRGALTVPAIVEFVELWDTIRGVQLTEESDKTTWKLTASGTYTTKSAYLAFFSGRTRALAATELWSAGAPLKHKLHVWFAMKNRLWTADRLERRGLDHPEECALCCQEQETCNHIMVQCSFSRQIWYTLLLEYRLHRFTPDIHAEFATWWTSLSEALPRSKKKEINALVILVVRSIWLERNSRVFDRFATLPMEVCRKLRVEFAQWKRAKLCGDVGTGEE
jgi:hypothetical protein